MNRFVVSFVNRNERNETLSITVKKGKVKKKKKKKVRRKETRKDYGKSCGIKSLSSVE